MNIEYSRPDIYVVTIWDVNIGLDSINIVPGNIKKVGQGVPEFDVLQQKAFLRDVEIFNVYSYHYKIYIRTWGSCSKIYKRNF